MRPRTHGASATPMREKPFGGTARGPASAGEQRMLPRRASAWPKTTPFRTGRCAVRPIDPARAMRGGLIEDNSMPNQEAGPGADTTNIIDNVYKAAAAPDQLKPHERRAPKGDPDNPSKKEAEALAALEALLPADDLDWNSDEEFFERSSGFPVSRDRAAALLTDLVVSPVVV